MKFAFAVLAVLTGFAAAMPSAAAPKDAPMDVNDIEVENCVPPWGRCEVDANCCSVSLSWSQRVVFPAQD